MISFLFGNKKENDNLIFEESNQILKSLCILGNKYLLVGKLDGNLLIYDIKKKIRVYEEKISNQSINYLMTLKKYSNLFFSCSEEPQIKLFQLINVDENIFFKLIATFNFHISGVKRIRPLDNDDNKFASCSDDSTFVIWNIKGETLYRLKAQSHGLENFIIKSNNNKINNLVTLNNRGALSFYKNVNSNLFLCNVLLDLDYTSSYTMTQISNEKIIIGGYKSIQIVSLKNFQIDTVIKIKEPISFIYESNPNFIVFGLKNGKLEFRDRKKLSNLTEDQINSLEKNQNNFKFSKLFKEGEVEIFKNEVVVSFGIMDDLFICISDENIRFFKGSEKTNDNDKKKKYFIF